MTEPNTEDAGPLLTPADLANFATIPTAKAAAMIEDALAMAVVVAPCITAGGFAHRAAAKAIVRGAILRWHEAGSGAVVTQSTMSYGQTIDTRQPRRGMFLRSELDALKQMCRPADDTGGAFAIDLFPPAAPRLSAAEEFERDVDTPIW